MIENCSAALNVLLQGRIPEKIDSESITDADEKLLAERMNKLISFMAEVHDFIVPLSKGELTDIKMTPANFFGSPFKELHSRLRHLTMQAKQVANGDFTQRVDFMGDFSEAFNTMIMALDQNQTLLKKKIGELEHALSHIKNLEGILPICSSCKKIRLEGADPEQQEGWKPVEVYISERTKAEFSHSICPECMKKLYPDLDD